MIETNFNRVKTGPVGPPASLYLGGHKITMNSNDECDPVAAPTCNPAPATCNLASFLAYRGNSKVARPPKAVTSFCNLSAQMSENERLRFCRGNSRLLAVIRGKCRLKKNLLARAPRESTRPTSL